MDIPTYTSPADQNPQVQKSSNFFSLFGKIVLVLLVIGGLTYGGYYLVNLKKNSEIASSPVKVKSALEHEVATPVKTNSAPSVSN